MRQLTTTITSVLTLLLWSTSGLADSQIGFCPRPGNELNPTDLSGWQVPDDNGISLFKPNSRSPTGLLYPVPQQIPKPQQTANGWLYNVFAELGYLGTSGDDDVGKFNEYGDFDPGLLANFNLTAEQPATAIYVNALAAAIGRDDQYYQLEVGRYGSFKIRGFFNAIPHQFTHRAISVWDGAGSGELTLRDGLIPGNSTADQVSALLAQSERTTLALTREKLGLSMTVQPTDAMQLYGNVSSEWRDGSRAFGGTFFYPNFGQAMETIEPIDYLTHDIALGIRYSATGYQFNLGYSGSFFRNDISSLTWENPGLSAFDLSFTPERGRFALSPDNDYHRLAGDFATRLPWWRGRLTASASYSEMRQDEDLLPHVVDDGFGANGFDLTPWSTTDGLSQQSANARFNSLTAQTQLTFAPGRHWNLRTKLRYQDQDNKTDYLNLNPLTGEFGHIVLDGGAQALFGFEDGVYDPERPGSRVHIRNIPFEKDSLLLTLNADRRLGRRSRMGVGFEHETLERPNRERAETNESRIKLNLSNRSLGWMTARVSYEYADRSGDEYEYNPYEYFYSSSLPDYQPLFGDGDEPHTLSALRKFDLADRVRHLFNARFNFLLRQDQDAFVSFQYSDEDFAGQYGLNETELYSLNAEWNYQVSRRARVFAFYNFQQRKRTQANITDDGGVSSNPDPGGPVYPLENAWSEAVKEKNQVFGLGFESNFDRMKLTGDYLYTRARSQFRYSFAGPGSFAFAVPIDEVGNGFPDQEYRSQRFQTGLHFRLNNRVGIRLLHHYEQIKIDDFHYAGIEQPLIGDILTLGAIPEDFSVHTFAVLVQIDH